MSVSVEVETARRAQAMLIPVQALRGEDEQGQSTVRVIERGRVAERLVRLGLRTLESVEVLQGLSEGEKVLMGATPALGRRVQGNVGAKTAGVAPKAGGASKDTAGSAMSNAIGR